MKRFAIIGRLPAMLAISLLCASCAKDASPPSPAQLGFTQGSVFTLKGTGLRVVDVSAPTNPPPSLGGGAQTTPVDIARAYARDRLRVSGGVGYVVLRVLDARVIEEPLDATHGFFGRMAGEADRQLKGTLKAELVLYGGPKEKEPSRITAEASATRAVPAASGPNGAAAVYNAMLESLARDFDGALSAQLTSYLATP